MSYRYTVPALLDRLLEELHDDNYEYYEDDCYASPVVFDDPEWAMAQLRFIFRRVSEVLEEAEKLYEADISLKGEYEKKDNVNEKL